MIADGGGNLDRHSHIRDGGNTDSLAELDSAWTSFSVSGTGSDDDDT
jgi:hypothetical protein